MTAAPTPLRRLTLTEYVRFEEASEEKYEYHNGDILAMSGTSPEHALITANVTGAIHARLQGKPCRIYSSNLSVAVIATDRAVHPDATIVCGALEFHPEDETRHVVTNPRVIIEVLSPTTEAYDRGVKFAQYQKIPSLQEYVLVLQSEARVETFVRRADGSWLLTPYIGAEAVAALRSIELEVPLAEIYADVAFAVDLPEASA